MRIIATIVIGLALVSGCTRAPSPSGFGEGSGGGVVANFGYAVGTEIRGRYDPAIFQKDKVDGHVRRACKNDALERAIHTQSGGVVTFVARCRLGVLKGAEGRWIVRRRADGLEKAERSS